MPTEHIVKVLPSEGQVKLIYIKVQSNGSKLLDLALLATDGDSAWESTIKHSSISKLRSKHSPLDDNEWENILSSILLPRAKDGERRKSKAVEKLELSSSLSGDRLTIVVRRNISEITQRLGEIILQEIGEEEASDRVELLDWVGIAVDRTGTLEAEIVNLDDKYRDQAKTVEQLQKQLEELIEAKKEHEASLLEKFALLLNEKKLKIRDQQRIIASAKEDPRKAEQVQALRRAKTSRRPLSSATKKRKAHGGSPTNAESESDDDDAAFNDAPAENGNEETPLHSDVDATEDESEDENMGSAPPPAPTGKGRILETHDEPSSLSPPHDTQLPALPPRRELPFTRKATSPDRVANQTNPAPAGSLANGAASSSETSDDEL